MHHDLREADKESSSREETDLDARLAKFASTVAGTEGDTYTHYPSNVRLPNLCYFMLAPTLCYQLDFPRTPRVRKMYLLSLCLRVLLLWTLIPAFVVQYVLPILDESVSPILRRDLMATCVLLLKLAVPVTYVWCVRGVRCACEGVCVRCACDARVKIVRAGGVRGAC